MPQCSPVPVYNIVKQQQLYFRDDGFPINVVVQRIVTNRLIEKAKKNGQSGFLVLTNCHFMIFIVVVAILTGVCLTIKLQLSFYNLPLRILMFSFSIFLFFFQENCRTFQTISFTPPKLLSLYIFFCFTFLISFQTKEYLREKIKNTKD